MKMSWSYSKWQQIKQNVPSLNRGLSNLWWLRSINYVKFTKECAMWMDKHVLIRKIFTNGLNMGLPELKSQSFELKLQLSGKNKVLRTVVSKEGYTDSLLVHERTHD